MRLRQVLISAALMFLTLSTARAALTPTDPIGPGPAGMTDSRVAAYVDMNLPPPMVLAPTDPIEPGWHSITDIRVAAYVEMNLPAPVALAATDAIEPGWHSIPDSRVTAYVDMNLPLPAAPSPLVAEDKLVASAYYDTLSILSTKNNCSDFFGGPEAAVDVFSRLIGQMKKHYGSSGIAMEMSGSISNVLDARTNKQSRIFEKVRLNANGPFYRSRPNVEARVGSYRPNTREARVLIFLHEMGHVVRGADGKWLLPNDGTDESLSSRNSSTIESICGSEINGLTNSATATMLARRAEDQFSKIQSGSPPEQ